MLFGFEVVVESEVPPTVRVPDLIVLPQGRGRQRVPARDVILVVEIIAPGSRALDTHLKAYEYARAGIPHYWLVDLDPPAPSITVLGVRGPDARYERRTVTGQLVVTEPFPLRIDIDALVSPRA